MCMGVLHLPAAEGLSSSVPFLVSMTIKIQIISCRAGIASPPNFEGSPYNLKNAPLAAAFIYLVASYGGPATRILCCHCVVLDHIISPEQIQKDREGTREVSNSSLFGTK